MPHILFVTLYYPPEKAAPAVRISETTARLVAQGYEVTVLTTVPNYPTGIVPPAYRGQIVGEEWHQGVHVVRVWSYTSPNRGFLRRILAQLSFGCLAPLLGWNKVGRPDVIIVESPPLFNAIGGRILSYFKQSPFIFIVSDLWPESAVQLGMLRNRILIRLAEWLEWSTYQRASLIWAVTEGIRTTIIKRGLSAKKVFLLTNGVDTDKFRPLPRAQARSDFGWENKFTALYAGTHGLAHGLTTLLDAAERLDARPDIQIVLAGDGATKKDLVAEAQRRCLTNVHFLEPLPHERVPQLLAAADVCLIPLKKLPLFEGALPSKMYEAMACARPIVLSVAGEASRLAERDAGAAIAVEPENADALAAAILHLYEHPEHAELLMQRGRAFVEKRFDRNQLVAKLDEHIKNLLNQRGHAKRTDSSFYPYWYVAMNLSFGLIGGTLLLSLLPLLALFVYLDSPGPIFYSQERVGYKGTTFRMYKFRTMCVDAGCAWATHHDPRVTRIGRFLRATHLDELPQVINILRGEMSLVGPRPEVRDFAAKLEATLPHYRDRLAIKPGLTGWAQVMHDYGDILDDEKMKLAYDFYYIENQSVRLDVQIILKTVVEVLSAHGR
ncbi:MAG: sugar transferase [Chloroflexota bacterium]|nr:sugar transferase [Chloroflexota bacterium]